MEQFVINIGRQLGSGGRTVGEIIARRLGVKLYDKELINLAARESGICSEFFEKADEKESRGVISTVVGYLRAPFVGDDGGVTNVLSNDALFKIQSDVIRAVAARESAVFVGRCRKARSPQNPSLPYCRKGLPLCRPFPFQRAVFLFRRRRSALSAALPLPR